MSKYKHAEIVGPFKEPEWHYAVIDGYKVPYIKLVPLTGANDGKIEIHVEDTSCCFIIEDSSIDVVLCLLAKAMAVAAGYNKHGDGSKIHNPFKVKMTGISI
jgi:hypothetical protein